MENMYSIDQITVYRDNTANAGFTYNGLKDLISNSITSSLNTFSRAVVENPKDPNHEVLFRIRSALKAFLEQFIEKYKLYTLLNPETLRTLVGDIFSSSQITDFVFTLKTHFFLQSGLTESEIEHLKRHIALSIYVKNTALTLIPGEISTRIAIGSLEDMIECLDANDFLLPLIIASSHLSTNEISKL